MITMIIAARLAPLPTTNEGVVIVVGCHRRPVLTALSNATRVTASVAVAVCVSDPLVPVIVSGYVPIGVLVLVVTDSVDEDAAGFGEKLPLAPAGSPPTVNVT
jgi:hypothetical protein